METKIFGDKKIVIRKIQKSDIQKAKEFQSFINSLVEEDAKLLMNQKIKIKEEVKFLENILKTTKKKNRVFLLATCGNKIVGTVSVELERWRRNHIGKLGIAVRDGYRGIGLGKHLMSEVITLAKKDLKPRPKIIQLEVYANNKPAMNLYKKIGFKIVAKLPKQVQYKGKLVDDFTMVLYV